MARRITIACPNLSLDRTMAVKSIHRGHVHRSTQSDARGGGKGVNVARALACVGVHATVVGLAAGRTGEAVVAMLQDEGIDTRAVWFEGETRSCLTVVDDDAITVFNEAGDPLSGATWDEFEATVAGALNEGALLVVSGSFPPQTPDDGAARLVEEAHVKGCVAICDTSRSQLAEALTARPDVVTPNLSEALALLEGIEGEAVETGPEARDRGLEAAHALVERGAACALVTLGAVGAVSSRRGHAGVWPAPTVDVVNPVGAGDCLVAGLAWGLSTGEDFDGCIRRGLAMSAASCETFPAGLLDVDRYEELLRSVN
jgi:1-phosphofructokinase family hexose kinase